jgi:hypothetical protein
MSQLINSGIIYLEQFVDDTNLLPADLSRSLAYIRTLDERISSAAILPLIFFYGVLFCLEWYFDFMLLPLCRPCPALLLEVTMTMMFVCYYFCAVALHNALINFQGESIEIVIKSTYLQA